jgi:hypothetical protein
VSGWVCALCGGKCTTSGAFCGVATAPRVGRCESDESAAEDDVAESVDIVRLRSIGVRGCTGSVAAECADDVDGRRKIELENCLPGDAEYRGADSADAWRRRRYGAAGWRGGRELRLRGVR